LLGAVWACVLSATLTLGRRRIARLFSDDPAVVDIVVGCIPWLIGMLCLGNAVVRALASAVLCCAVLCCDVM